jgi:carbon storage regulator
MLVLTRKRSESILIGDGVRLVVVKIERGGVRIGIEAPASVPILRSELTEYPEAGARRKAPLSTSATASALA